MLIHMLRILKLQKWDGVSRRVIIGLTLKKLEWGTIFKILKQSIKIIRLS